MHKFNYSKLVTVTTLATITVANFALRTSFLILSDTSVYSSGFTNE